MHTRMPFHCIEWRIVINVQMELDLGVVCPAGGSQRLPRMVGVTLAKELIFTGAVTYPLYHLSETLLNEMFCL